MEKAMKKSWFNYRLYLDGIKQLKIIGIMGAIIMGCTAFLISLGSNINNSNYVEYCGNDCYVSGRIGMYDILEMNPCIILTFLIVVPLMTLYLFNYLNRRNACDFYHAIPDTRESLFTSYGAAIITWNVFLVIESMIISAASAGAFKYVELNPENIPVTLINTIAGCIFVFGVFAISMSVTGTVFTNIAVAAMLLAAPRIIVTVFVLMITEANPLIPFEFGSGLLDDRLNVVTNVFTGFVFRGSYDGLQMWPSAVYTFLVGLFYCVSGMILFKIRKSEAATSAAVNKVLQCILRLVPAMLICLLPAAYIYMAILNKETIYTEDKFMLAVCYIAAVISYLLYELVTTKKLKNVVKAIPGLIWIVVYNVVMVVAMLAGYNIVLNDIPKTSEVKSVNIAFQDSDFYSFGTGTDYYENVMSQIDYTSDEIKELLVRVLERNLEQHKAGESLYGRNDSGMSSVLGGKRLEVTFDCGLSDKKRYIYLSRQDGEALMTLLSENEQLKEAIYSVAASEDISSIISSMNISKEKLEEIYASYAEELRTLDFEAAFHNALGYADGDSNDTIVVVLKNGKRLRIVLGEKTPKTYSAYINEINSANQKINPVAEFLKAYEEADRLMENVEASEYFERYGHFRITLLDEESYNMSNGIEANFNMWKYNYDQSESDRNFSESKAELLKKIAAELENCNEAELDFSKRYARVYLDLYDYEADKGSTVYKYYQVSDELYDLMAEYNEL